MRQGAVWDGSQRRSRRLGAAEADETTRPQDLYLLGGVRPLPNRRPPLTPNG
jgi:hypothetical protein